MYLVDEKDCAAASLAIQTGFTDRSPQIFYARENGREGDEFRVGSLGQQSRQSRLAGSWRSPKDQRRKCGAAFNQTAKHATLADQLLLSDKLAERARPHPIGKR